MPTRGEIGFCFAAARLKKPCRENAVHDVACDALLQQELWELHQLLPDTRVSKIREPSSVSASLRSPGFGDGRQPAVSRVTALESHTLHTVLETGQKKA